MNRTALSVVALAVGSVLILGLYNIYKPQTNSMVHDTFDKVRITNMASNKTQPSQADDPTPRFNAQGIDQYGLSKQDWHKGVNIKIMNTGWETVHGGINSGEFVMVHTINKDMTSHNNLASKIDWSHPKVSYGKMKCIEFEILE